jgi:hypothetical protein
MNGSALNIKRVKSGKRNKEKVETFSFWRLWKRGAERKRWRGKRQLGNITVKQNHKKLSLFLLPSKGLKVAESYFLSYDFLIGFVCSKTGSFSSIFLPSPLSLFFLVLYRKSNNRKAKLAVSKIIASECDASCSLLFPQQLVQLVTSPKKRNNGCLF